VFEGSKRYFPEINAFEMRNNSIGRTLVESVRFRKHVAAREPSAVDVDAIRGAIIDERGDYFHAAHLATNERIVDSPTHVSNKAGHVKHGIHQYGMDNEVIAI
jgi:hypothetical protein